MARSRDEIKKKLLEAILAQNLQEVQKIVEFQKLEGTKLDRTHMSFSAAAQSPLSVAIEAGNFEIVRYLVENNSDLLANAKDVHYISTKPNRVDNAKPLFDPPSFWTFARKRADNGDKESIEIAQYLRGEIKKAYLEKIGKEGGDRKAVEEAINEAIEIEKIRDEQSTKQFSRFKDKSVDRKDTLDRKEAKEAFERFAENAGAQPATKNLQGPPGGMRYIPRAHQASADNPEDKLASPPGGPKYIPRAHITQGTGPESEGSENTKPASAAPGGPGSPGFYPSGSSSAAKKQDIADSQSGSTSQKSSPENDQSPEDQGPKPPAGPSTKKSRYKTRGPGS